MEPSGKEVQDVLSFQIKTISELVQQQITNTIASLDLTSSQAFLLGYLCHRHQRGEVVYPRDIERHFQLSHPTVSGLLKRLEAKGFLLLEPSPEDRRCKRILVTDRAIHVSTQLRQGIDDVNRQLAAGMTAEEISQLRGFLNRMIANISPVKGGIHP